MSYATIDHLRESLAQPTRRHSPEYVAKMLHDVPAATVVDRAVFLLDQVRGRRVLEFGASGPMHEAILAAAATCVGVDRESGLGVLGFDLDDVTAGPLPQAEVDVIVCGEVIEHLANPGWFLTRLRRQYPGLPVAISVPNAFSSIAAGHMARDTENVNIDHVAWYSYRTLRTLLERVGYRIEAFHWYGGEPGTAEGLVVVAR